MLAIFHITSKLRRAIFPPTSSLRASYRPRYFAFILLLYFASNENQTFVLFPSPPKRRVLTETRTERTTKEEGEKNAKGERARRQGNEHHRSQSDESTP